MAGGRCSLWKNWGLCPPMSILCAWLAVTVRNDSSETSFSPSWSHLIWSQAHWNHTILTVKVISWLYRHPDHYYILATYELSKTDTSWWLLLHTKVHPKSLMLLLLLAKYFCHLKYLVVLYEVDKPTGHKIINPLCWCLVSTDLYALHSMY